MLGSGRRSSTGIGSVGERAVWAAQVALDSQYMWEWQIAYQTCGFGYRTGGPRSFDDVVRVWPGAECD
jgi:hypothetical protein